MRRWTSAAPSSPSSGSALHERLDQRRARRIGDATELQLASWRDDQTLSASTTTIGDASHAKHDRYGPGPVGHVTGPDNHAVTIHLLRSEP